MPPRKQYQKAHMPETIKEIRNRYYNGESTYRLADQYYVCRQTIWEYVKDIKDRARETRKRNITGVKV